ncbi:MAG: molybdopterin-synthase adenylyltransferase MoeB [Pseudobdellovibrionaceae bacterium]
MSLKAEEIKRYARQIRMPEVGEQGQLKLKNSAVLVIGLGGLGSPAALYLAAAGVGRLGLIDYDVVDVSNMHRQVLYSTDQIQKSKAEGAKERLSALNPEIKLEVYNEKLSIENALTLFVKYDLILDGADNFATRYLSNDAAFFAKKTLISASILGFEGQLSVFSQKGFCYRCLYPEPPPSGSVPSCAEAGVLGVLPGLFGVLQATEALKIILSLGETLESKILSANTLTMDFMKLEAFKNPECPLCGANPKIKSLREEHFVCSTDVRIRELTPEDFISWQKQKTFQLLDVREAEEFSEGKLSYTHHIPLKELENKYQALSQETPIVVYCRAGGRSQKACEFLQTKGFQVWNLEGGIQKNSK